MKIHAEKWHAYGNDFILFRSDLSDERRLARLTRLLCHRHEGVGADGVVCFDAIRADVRCRIFNRDGSEAEISGNGVRCLAGYLKRELPPEKTFRIQSAAGLKMLTFLRQDNSAFWFRADMGMPNFDPSALPAAIHVEQALPYSVAIEGRKLDVNLVSLGNPHCVVFVSEFNAEEWMRLGPKLESHAIFPRRVNVEFARVLDRHNIEIRTWERGVGKTSSSGTCSCASAAVAIQTGRGNSPLHVHNERGILNVEWRPGESIFLEGPAVPVWQGDFFWNDD